MNAALRLLPWATLIVLALLSQLVPAVSGALEYDRAAVSAGQLWRLIACHWTHWSADHLFWSGGTFAALTFVSRRTAPRLGLACVACSAVIVGVAVSSVTQLARYRGLSGIDCALFALLATLFLFENLAAGAMRRAAGFGALLLALATKLAYECHTGAALFVHEHAGGISPVPLAHVAGALTGLVIAAAARFAPASSAIPRNARLIRKYDCQPPLARG